MDKRRLESFSDGVFAIVITLLVLELKLPDVSYEALGRSLLQLLPSISAYVLSFLLIGMYWVFHHHAYTLITGVDGVLLWLNIVFLLLISFMPFPTMMLGRFPGQTLPVVFYGCNLLLANMHGLAMLLYLRRAPRLASRRFTPALFRKQVRIYLVVNGLYAVNIGLAFVLPRVAMIIFGAMAVYLMVRSAMIMGIGTCPSVPADEPEGIESAVVAV
ncbi:MAG: TMEM175 family protein [Vicinamibacterales bacterium]